jgi:hypothetical protein
MYRTAILARIIIFSFAVVLAPLAMGAELRPLNLPSSQMQAAPQQAPPQQVMRVAPPTVYDRFRNQVIGLNTQQKEEYRHNYQTSLDQAESNGEQDAAAYYRELLNILNEF